ncbi:MAG: hypothetical protein H7A35_03175 [Planctomycetales bacterium]|nr:hypothetical protein [bacterium]UNM09058.1 MAG: hypothetical protein H7A35_03175 [Planctomycetales bacterium]
MFALAMLQGDDTTGMMLIALVVLTLVSFVVLGLKFFVNLFEVVTAPGASLKHHGQSDTAFYSFAVVFLGHLIGSIVLVLNRAQMSAGYQEFAVEFGKQLAMSNPNGNYRDVAANWATGKLDVLYQTMVDSNLLWLGLFGLFIWVIAGLVFFLAAKMFGSPVSLSDMMSTTAYPMFFYTIGWCCYTAASFSSFAVFGDGFKPASLMGNSVLYIVGSVIMLYAVILYAIAFMQATDLGFGQLIVGYLLYSLIMGGIYFGVTSKIITPAVEQFASDVVSLDFSKSGYKLPGSEGP